MKISVSRESTEDRLVLAVVIEGRDTGVRDTLLIGALQEALHGLLSGSDNLPVRGTTGAPVLPQKKHLEPLSTGEDPLVEAVRKASSPQTPACECDCHVDRRLRHPRCCACTGGAF